MAAFAAGPTREYHRRTLNEEVETRCMTRVSMRTGEKSAVAPIPRRMGTGARTYFFIKVSNNFGSFGKRTYMEVKLHLNAKSLVSPLDSVTSIFRDTSSVFSVL